jgi:hypothetical protein
LYTTDTEGKIKAQARKRNNMVMARLVSGFTTEADMSIVDKKY